MSTQFEDLIVLQKAERLTDGIWQVVVHWDEFAKDALGKQLVRAADSIGANIAEAFGRYNYGEKIQFLYYARGSLYETKYWLNRALTRGLLSRELVDEQAAQLTEVSRLINAYVSRLKEARQPTSDKKVREEAAPYLPEPIDSLKEDLITANDLAWIGAFPADSVILPYPSDSPS